MARLRAGYRAARQRLKQSARTDGTILRADFAYDHSGDVYTCPAGDALLRRHAGQRLCSSSPDAVQMRQLARSAIDLRRRSRHGARNRRIEDYTARRQRKKIKMLFAHPKRILKLTERPRGAPDGLHLAATRKTCRELAKLIPPCPSVPAQEGHEASRQRAGSLRGPRLASNRQDFFNDTADDQTVFRHNMSQVARFLLSDGGACVRPADKLGVAVLLVDRLGEFVRSAHCLRL